MDHNIFCVLLAHIDWLWYTVSILAVYLTGALWYSVLFPKMWIKIFKVDVKAERSAANTFATMFGQLVATALLGLGIFMTVGISIWLAVVVAAGLCGWQKGNLKYQFARWSDYFRAACITAGYTAVASVIFIVFALM